MSDAVQITATSTGFELAIKVVPGASRTKVLGVWNVALRVAVAAPPEAGKANAVLVACIAEFFGVRRADIELVSGSSQPLKRLRIAGLSAAEAAARLQSAGICSS